MIIDNISSQNYILHELATKNKGSHVRRNFEEPQVEHRSEFQRDRDRILYSQAFRRLMHKTQVCFTGKMNEHIRTRLTHTLEVAQISRTMARLLKVNEDLVEAIALGHDVGHTPFGHTGGKVLHEIICGKDVRICEEFRLKTGKIGFKHNYQSVRVLMKLEKGYPDFDGLNLTFPVLEGILKHTKIKINGDFVKYYDIQNHKDLYIQNDFSCSIEGQIVAIADEIAQVCHDIEDAIEADYHSKKIILAKLDGMLNNGCFEGIEGQHFIGEVNDKKECMKIKYIKSEYIKKLMSWIINKIVVDSVQMIKIDMDDYLKKYSPDTDGNYYPLREQIASKDTVLRKIKLYSELEKIENNYVLNNYKINLIDGKAKYVLRRIFKAYLTNPKQLPDSVLRKYTKVCNIDGLKQEIEIIGLNEKTRNIRYLDGDLFKKYQNEIITDNWFLRVVCDYISSMTDLFCISEYQKLYGGDSIGDNQPYTMN